MVTSFASRYQFFSLQQLQCYINYVLMYLLIKYPNANNPSTHSHLPISRSINPPTRTIPSNALHKHAATIYSRSQLHTIFHRPNHSSISPLPCQFHFLTLLLFLPAVVASHASLPPTYLTHDSNLISFALAASKLAYRSTRPLATYKAQSVS